MKNLKKRLPVLILAFMIAVMPLAMAAPVNADSGVLSGSSSGFDFSFSFSSTEFLVPSVSFNGVPVNELSFPVIAYLDSDVLTLVVIPYTAFKTVAVDAAGRLYFEFSGSYYHDKYVATYNSGSWSSFELISIDHFAFYFSSSDGSFSGFNLPSVASSSVYDVYSSASLVSRSPSLGVLSVFSGVSSWLAGAVNNMIPMFWTAEAGLTPIGVLTVCSLALAVMLLLFWLIAGWLKFK